jgi:hypothetical protein
LVRQSFTQIPYGTALRLVDRGSIDRAAIRVIVRSPRLRMALLQMAPLMKLRAWRRAIDLRSVKDQRDFYCIGITTDLNIDVFRIRVHVSHPCFLGFTLNPKKLAHPVYLRLVAGVAPKVMLDACHEKVLEVVKLEDLKGFAIDL